jgi:hypothetical protein
MRFNPFGCFLRAAIVSAALGTTAIASAQTSPPASPPDKNQENSSDKPLSKKLDENEGVLKPPHGIDPEIHQTPPASTGDKMPVIVPPGEPGGDQSIQPK